MENKGKLIVIDGTDGSGKATQTKLLVERLQKENYPVETISFPKYGQKSAGLIENYLSGKYGSAKEVGPYRASIFYAIDRYDSSHKMWEDLQTGKHIIADRYVGSNMGHQGGHIKAIDERLKFYDWEIKLEHETFGIPKPDLNIVLHVPAELAFQLIQKRNDQKGGIDKPLLDELKLLKTAEQAYLDIADRFDAFQIIECVENNQLLTRKEIHKRVFALVKPLIN